MLSVEAIGLDMLSIAAQLNEVLEADQVLEAVPPEDFGWSLSLSLLKIFLTHNEMNE